MSTYIHVDFFSFFSDNVGRWDDGDDDGGLWCGESAALSVSFSVAASRDSGLGILVSGHACFVVLYWCTAASSPKAVELLSGLPVPCRFTPLQQQHMYIIEKECIRRGSRAQRPP